VADRPSRPWRRAETLAPPAGTTRWARRSAARRAPSVVEDLAPAHPPPGQTPLLRRMVSVGEAPLGDQRSRFPRAAPSHEEASVERGSAELRPMAGATKRSAELAPTGGRFARLTAALAPLAWAPLPGCQGKAGSPVSLAAFPHPRCHRATREPALPPAAEPPREPASKHRTA
jgi:hypothetical protein